MDDANGTALSVVEAAALMKGGRLDEAAARAAQGLATAEGAEVGQLRNLLGLVSYRRGRAHEALVQFSQALAVEPANATYLINAAGAMRGLGRLPEAADALTKAVAVAPDNLEARRGLISLSRRLGRLDAAEAMAVETVERFPDKAEAHLMLGRVFQAKGQYAEAVSAYDEALDLAPDDVETLCALGYAQIELRHLPQAIETLTRATERDPRSAEAFTLLGKARLRTGDADGAEQALRRAVGVDETAAEAWMGLASLFTSLGRVADARDALRVVIKHQPDHPHALYQLALHGEPLDPARLEGFAEKRGVGRSAKRYYLSSAGEATLAAGDVDRAFALFKASNDLRRQELTEHGQGFDADTHAAAVTALIKACPGDSFSDLHGGVMSEAPVFLVGVPQSGVRIIGKLLDTHPDIFVMDENANIARLAAGVGFPDKQERLNPAATKAMAKDYLDSLEKAHPGKRRIVDASPGNFMWLGLIARLFPRARIVHVQRNAVDCCLWSYLRNLGQHRAYSHDLVELGRYYVEYERLMAYWQAVLPNPTLTVRLEDFVETPETVLRRLLRFLGVPWRNECIPNAHDMGTARASIGRWRDFDAHLGPLKIALSGEYEPDPGEDLPKPAPVVPLFSPEPEPEPLPEPAPVSKPAPAAEVAEVDDIDLGVRPVPAQWFGKLAPETASPAKPPAPKKPTAKPSGLALLADHLGKVAAGRAVDDSAAADYLARLRAPVVSGPAGAAARRRIGDGAAAQAAWSLAHLAGAVASPAPAPVEDEVEDWAEKSIGERLLSGIGRALGFGA